MIPKIIHYCWFGHGEIPEKDKRCIESWKVHCPNYKIVRWDESNYDVSKNKYMQEAYEAKKWGFVPDYARLDIIYEYGGIYLDTDVELIRNIDVLLDNSVFMGFESDSAVSPGLGFGAEKNNPLIGELLHTIYDRLRFIREDGSYDTKPSPSRNTEFLMKKGLQLDGMFQKLSCGLTIYPKEYFCPLEYETGIINITEYTYSIHHFHASWCTKEELKAHELAQKIARKFGKRTARIVTQIYILTYALKNKLSNNGLVGTMKFIIMRIKNNFANGKKHMGE